MYSSHGNATRCRPEPVAVCAAMYALDPARDRLKVVVPFILIPGDQNLGHSYTLRADLATVATAGAGNGAVVQPRVFDGIFPVISSLHHNWIRS